MKVLMLETNELEEFKDECYAARLIEQGKAVLVPAAKKPEPKKAEPKARKKE